MELMSSMIFNIYQMERSQASFFLNCMLHQLLFDKLCRLTTSHLSSAFRLGLKAYNKLTTITTLSDINLCLSNLTIGTHLPYIERENVPQC